MITRGLEHLSPNKFAHTRLLMNQKHTENCRCKGIDPLSVLHLNVQKNKKQGDRQADAWEHSHLTKAGLSSIVCEKGNFQPQQIKNDNRSSIHKKRNQKAKQRRFQSGRQDIGKSLYVSANRIHHASPDQVVGFKVFPCYRWDKAPAHQTNSQHLLIAFLIQRLEESIIKRNQKHQYKVRARKIPNIAGNREKSANDCIHTRSFMVQNRKTNRYKRRIKEHLKPYFND